MKKILFTLAAMALLAFSCNTEDDLSAEKTIHAGEEVTLALNQTAVLVSDQLNITFTRVIEDSRCPTKVQCVWEGRAVVEFTFAKTNATVIDSLATRSSNSKPPDSTFVFDRKIKLLEVTPYPEAPASIPPKDYKVKFVVN